MNGVKRQVEAAAQDFHRRYASYVYETLPRIYEHSNVIQARFREKMLAEICVQESGGGGGGGATEVHETLFLRMDVEKLKRLLDESTRDDSEERYKVLEYLCEHISIAYGMMEEVDQFIDVLSNYMIMHVPTFGEENNCHERDVFSTVVRQVEHCASEGVRGMYVNAANAFEEFSSSFHEIPESKLKIDRRIAAIKRRSICFKTFLAVDALLKSIPWTIIAMLSVCVRGIDRSGLSYQPGFETLRIRSNSDLSRLLPQMDTEEYEMRQGRSDDGSKKSSSCPSYVS